MHSTRHSNPNDNLAHLEGTEWYEMKDAFNDRYTPPPCQKRFVPIELYEECASKLSDLEKGWLSGYITGKRVENDFGSISDQWNQTKLRESTSNNSKDVKRAIEAEEKLHEASTRVGRIFSAIRSRGPGLMGGDDHQIIRQAMLKSEDDFKASLRQ